MLLASKPAPSLSCTHHSGSVRVCECVKQQLCLSGNGHNARLLLVDEVKCHALLVSTTSATDTMQVLLKVGLAAAAGDANALLVLDGKIVVDNDVAPVNVDALRKDVRRNEEVLLAPSALQQTTSNRRTHV